MNKKKLFIILSVVVALIIAGVITTIIIINNKENDDLSSKTSIKSDTKVLDLIKETAPENWQFEKEKVNIDKNGEVSIIYNSISDWMMCTYHTKNHIINISNKNSNELDGIKSITFICRSNNSETKAKYSNIESINSLNFESHAEYFDNDGNKIETSFENAFKNAATAYSYKEIFRNPSEYIEKKIKLTGKVVQVMEETEDGIEYWVLRVDMTKDKWGYYDDTVMILLPKSSFKGRIIEDDVITFYGLCYDTYTYETVLGASQTIPFILGIFAELS